MELDTGEIMGCVATVGDALVEMEVGDDLNAIAGVLARDFANKAFARGFMLGVSSVLKCGGIPHFLSGTGATELKQRILGLSMAFQIAEFLDKKESAA